MINLSFLNSIELKINTIDNASSHTLSKIISFDYSDNLIRLNFMRIDALSLAIHIFYEDGAYRFTIFTILCFIIDGHKFVWGLIKLLLWIQHVEHLRDNLPRGRVVSWKYLVEIDVACLLVKRDDRVMHSLIYFLSFFVFIRVVQRQIVIL